MSVENVDRVDSVGVIDGWVVITIFQLEPWEPEEERVEQLRRKIATCESIVQRDAFLVQAHRLPVRLRLVSTEVPPAAVMQVAFAAGIEVVAGDPAPPDSSD